MYDYYAICILFKYTHNVLDVEALSTVVQQFRHISVIQLLSVKLLAPVLVDDMAVATLHEPAKAIDPSSFLVNVEILLGLQKLGNCASCSLV